MPQVSAAQELQTKAQIRLASLIEEKLVTQISVLSTLLGGGKTTERLLVRISIETHKTSPDFDQTAADKAKNRIKQGVRRNWLRRVHRNGPITHVLQLVFGDWPAAGLDDTRLS